LQASDNIEQSFDGRTFVPLPTMPEVKYRHCMRFIDKTRLIVAGGVTKTTTDWASTNTGKRLPHVNPNWAIAFAYSIWHFPVFMYSRESETWTQLANMTQRRTGFGCWVVENDMGEKVVLYMIARAMYSNNTIL
jgi:hypothetical protein